MWVVTNFDNLASIAPTQSRDFRKKSISLEKGLVLSPTESWSYTLRMSFSVAKYSPNFLIGNHNLLQKFQLRPGAWVLLLDNAPSVNIACVLFSSSLWRFWTPTVRGYSLRRGLAGSTCLLLPRPIESRSSSAKRLHRSSEVPLYLYLLVRLQTCVIKTDSFILKLSLLYVTLVRSVHKLSYLKFSNGRIKRLPGPCAKLSLDVVISTYEYSLLRDNKYAWILPIAASSHIHIWVNACALRAYYFTSLHIIFLCSLLSRLPMFWTAGMPCIFRGIILKLKSTLGYHSGTSFFNIYNLSKLCPFSFIGFVCPMLIGI